MKTRNEALKAVILSFENDEINTTEALKEIERISSKKVEEYTLLNYWRSTSLQSFVDVLLVEEIKDWKTLDDSQSIELIEEILTNVTSDVIIEKNGAALEKRYNKPQYTICLLYTSDAADD